MGISISETVYDAVVFQNRVGTLTLSEDQLSHRTAEKVSLLPWKKVVKRQVTTSASVVVRPMFKLILRSGTECVFTMENRVSLEVLRDDLGERLQTYRKMHPEEADHVAVNKTRSSFSDRRSSTPYSLAVPQREYIYGDKLENSANMNNSNRRASNGSPPFCRTLSSETIKHKNSNPRRSANYELLWV